MPFPRPGRRRVVVWFDFGALYERNSSLSDRAGEDNWLVGKVHLQSSKAGKTVVLHGWSGSKLRWKDRSNPVYFDAEHSELNTETRLHMKRKGLTTLTNIEYALKVDLMSLSCSYRLLPPKRVPRQRLHLLQKGNIMEVQREERNNKSSNYPSLSLKQEKKARRAKQAVFPFCKLLSYLSSFDLSTSFPDDTSPDVLLPNLPFSAFNS
ncbi:hypothetical protein Syun_001395 [Stephania yunnanensis]|uniref:Uncharacterized protein n=1 Tax=Stephania yunnanensis TaxID=152371 RepID=A0AAP0Q6F3_9MAGN